MGHAWPLARQQTVGSAIPLMSRVFQPEPDSIASLEGGSSFPFRPGRSHELLILRYAGSSPLSFVTFHRPRVLLGQLLKQELAGLLLGLGALVEAFLGRKNLPVIRWPAGLAPLADASSLCHPLVSSRRWFTMDCALRTKARKPAGPGCCPSNL